MILLKPVILSWCVYVCMIVSLTVANRRPKRVLGGLPLVSHDNYGTHFMIKMQETFECISEQFDHKLKDCYHQQRCGGSLIKPDFVLTACHCVTYEYFYAEGVWLPPYPKVTIDDIPKYIDDRINNQPFDKDDEKIVYPSTVEVKHPLLNTMTLFAGNANGDESTQKRHAAKYFMHHLCAERQDRAEPESWSDVFKYYEMDIGLVKPCFPFVLNQDVKLAPMKAINALEQHLQKVISQNTVCMVAGWGMIVSREMDWTEQDRQQGYGMEEPNILHHMFTVSRCYAQCYNRDHNCLICGTAHGTKPAAAGPGDSGGPLLCDSVVTGVVSRGKYYPKDNETLTMAVAVACVKDFITEGHLGYLRSTDTEAFHYFNGQPLPNGTQPKSN